MKTKTLAIILLILVISCFFPLIGNTAKSKTLTFYMDNQYIQTYKNQLGVWKTDSTSVHHLTQKMGTTVEDVKKINNGSTNGVVFVPMGIKYYNDLINAGKGRRELRVDARQMSWPIDKVYYTSRYGPRAGTMHTGLDIACGIGTPVLAAEDGVITHSGVFGALGKAVAIKHKKGIQTWYGHNSQLMLRPGDRVQRGQIIAFSGNTGRSTGPHVHFEIRYMDIVLNPEDFLMSGYTRPNMVYLENSPLEIAEETTLTTTDTNPN